MNKRKLKKYAKKKGLPMPLNPGNKFYKDAGKFPAVKKLTGGQAKIAAKAPPTNKIDEKDFAVLRAEKAKGRGMGLQDEKVQPGKVMKAKRGDFMKRRMKLAGLGSGAGKGMGQATGYKKYLEGLKEATKSSKAKKAAKIAKSTKIGKMMLPVVAAGVAAQQYLKSKLSSKEDRNKKMLRDYREQKKPGVPSQKTQDINKALNRLKGDVEGSIAPYKTKKKMGGGMMMKPMGYKSGTMVMARGCKLGRKKATKIT